MPNRFEGWYFKQQCGQNLIAFIPAIHTQRGGKCSGSVQIITPDKSYYAEIPGEVLSVTRRPLAINMGESTFTLRGVDLNIQGDGITVTGCLHFSKLSPPRGDIMGPYQLIPFMECRHSVFSLTHTVKGSLTVNGRLIDFTGGTGYTEGDKGSSFPKRYVWTQCNWFDNDKAGFEPCSLMLSAAEVSPLGRTFMGIIGTVYFRGREFRIATYKGAEVLSIGSGSISVRQGAYTLTAQFLESSSQAQRAQALRAPSSGKMVRLIKESLSCRARYIFSENGNVLFDFVSETASFEYEY